MVTANVPIHKPPSVGFRTSSAICHREPCIPAGIHGSRWQIALEVLKPTDGGLWIGTLAVTMAGTVVEQGLVELDRAGRVRVTFVQKGGGPRWSVTG